MYKEILQHVVGGVYPFHMPGHKGNAEFFPPEMLRLDVTEIAGMDVLSAPKGIIKRFLEKIAAFWGAEQSFFLTNGSSAGIVAAICATCGKDTPLFAARNSHVSFFNALIFCGATPNYCDFSPDSLGKLPRGAVVFVTSPTYEGIVADIPAIAEKVRAVDGILIVDEAHGAHFPFHDYFPASAVAAGADIIITGLHKTLPAISGCAVVHVCGSHVNRSRLRFFLNAMQTTSPSYMLMAACDFMLERLWQNPDLFEKYVARLKDFRREFSEILEPKTEPGKLLFTKSLPDSADVQFEYTTETHTLAMTSVADTDEGFARLRAVLTRGDYHGSRG